MEQSKKAVALGVLAVLVLSLGLFLIFNNDKKKTEDKKETEKKTEEKQNMNTNEGVIEEKTLGDIKFTNTSLKTEAISSTLVTSVINTSDKDIEVRIFDILVKDKDGKVIVTLQGYVGEVIPAGATKEIVSNVDMDLSTATDIEYKLVK